MVNRSGSSWRSHEPLPVGWRAWAVVAVGILLLAAPWTGAAGGMDFAAQVLVWAVLASSQELVTGRGGVITLTSGLYTVTGGAGVAIASLRFGAGPVAVTIGLLGAVGVVVVVEALLAGATWRVERWVYALASATVAAVLPLLAAASGMLHDGSAIAFDAPRWPSAASAASATTRARVGYGLLLALSIGAWLVLMRVANSPFGRVLPAVRDDPRLAEIIGYRPALHRSMSTLLAAVVAALAGGAWALWQQSSTSLVGGSLDITLQVLLIGWVAGYGTMWSAPVGAVVVLAAWHSLRPVLLIGASRVPDVPWLAGLLTEPSTQRWVLAAILCVVGWIGGGPMRRSLER